MLVAALFARIVAVHSRVCGYVRNRDYVAKLGDFSGALAPGDCIFRPIEAPINRLRAFSGTLS